MVALAGCGVVLLRGHVRMLLVGLLRLPVIGSRGCWFVVPRETFERLATIPEQLRGGGLNQRINIWSAGWHAFVQAPLMGTGAGSFVSAAGLSPMDTAHNTVLSILVDGGLCALFLAVAILALAVRSVLQTHGP